MLATTVVLTYPYVDVESQQPVRAWSRGRLKRRHEDGGKHAGGLGESSSCPWRVSDTNACEYAASLHLMPYWDRGECLGDALPQGQESSPMRFSDCSAPIQYVVHCAPYARKSSHPASSASHKHLAVRSVIKCFVP